MFDGRYLLKQCKGRGSFGEVWLATDQEIGVDFAIKIYVAMDQKGLEEFRKEYKLSCNLINSNLLHINKMEVSKEDGCPYLVMPYCPRGASKLVGQMSETDMWHFLQNIANGLAYLHEQTPPIIHQDIKPDNILQMESGDFVITDFGISKQLRATRSSIGGDSSGAVAYMGPERFQRGYTSIKSSDIWSLGATIYEMATGELPFEGKGGKMQSAGFETPQLPVQFSKELDDVMQACMNPEPWSRPSARQLADYASEIIKGHVVPPPFEIPNQAPAQPAYQQPAPQQPVPQQPAYQQPAPQQPAYQQPAPQPAPAYEPQPAAVAEGGKSNKNLFIAIGAVAAVVVVGLVVLLAGGGSSDEAEKPVTETEQVVTAASEEIDTTQSAVAQTTQAEAAPTTSEAQPQAQPAASVEEPKADKPKEEKVDKPKEEKKADTSSEKEETSGSGSLSLSYGKYKGAVKGGYPNGKGKLTYTTSRRVSKYDSKGTMAEPGDYAEGMFVNGFFTTGKLYSADGEVKAKISTGTPESGYESK